MLYKGEWWGWIMLVDDWGKDSWVLKYLCSWHNNIPACLKELKDVVDIDKEQIIEQIINSHV